MQYTLYLFKILQDKLLKGILYQYPTAYNINQHSKIYKKINHRSKQFNNSLSMKERFKINKMT